MPEVVDCPRCFGEGKIDLEDHAPVAAEVLKVVRKIQPASTAMIREWLDRELSTSCVNYHLYWLEDRDYIVRKYHGGIRYFTIRNGK